MRTALSSDSARDSIRSSILSRKVMERLVEIVQGHEKSVVENENPLENSPSDTTEAQPETEEEAPAQQESEEETEQADRSE